MTGDDDDDNNIIIIIIIIIIIDKYWTCSIDKNKDKFLWTDTVIVNAEVTTVFSNWPIRSDVSKAAIVSVTKVDDGCSFP